MIDADEARRRRERIAASVRLLEQEGLTPTAEGQALTERFALGQINIDQAVEQLTQLHRQGPPMISEAERAARKAAVDFARGSVRLEGLTLDPDIEALGQRFIAGELTLPDYIAAVKQAVEGS